MKNIVFCLHTCLLLFVVCEISGKLYGKDDDVCSDEQECSRDRLSKLQGVSKNKGISAKLLFVQLLFRHGDRSPVMIYKNDLNSKSFWEEGLGMLTKLGRQQHYRLGSYLRNLYKDFATFSPTEVRVTSTAYERALMSAESHLAALFAPPKKWQIDDGVNWQPIPIEYLPKEQDRYLLPNVQCVRANDESKRARQSPEGQRFHEEHSDAFRQMTLFSGERDLDMDYASAVFDTIRIEKKYKLKVPSWIEPLWDEMVNVTDHLYSWWFKTPLLKRLRTGPLIEKITDQMHKKIGGELKDQKFHVYSSHDQTVVMALTALDVFNKKQPPYCATVVFELHEMTDGSHSVRLLYLNSTEPETKIEDPHILTIPGCSEFCPLEYIDEYISHIVPDDWEAECQKEILLK